MRRTVGILALVAACVGVYAAFGPTIHADRAQHRCGACCDSEGMQVE